MKVLITAPSLDETRNVSGISTIVRQIIVHGRLDYVHFTAGREDNAKTDVLWLLEQIVLPFRFFNAIMRSKADVVHINTALTDLSIFRDAALAAAARLAGRHVVLAVHGGKYLMNEFSGRFVERIATGLLTRSKTVVVYSELELNALLERWPGVDVRVLPNAIPFEDVPPIDRNNDTPVIIYFGRMHESKGLHEIIEAVRTLRTEGKRFLFKAYGEGSLREFFVSGMTEALGGQFEYGGVISGTGKWEKLAGADIFVLPSRYGEGMPMAMLEAMAAGCLVIAADVASVTSVLTNGVNGYVVEPYKADQLTSILSEALDNKEGWRPLQDAAVKTVKEGFAISDYIQNLENIYADAAERR